MLTVIIDIQDHLLINGQTGNIMHNEFAQISDRKVYVNFSYEKQLNHLIQANKNLGFLLKDVKLRFR